MSGPWEDYKQEEGPWTDYQSQTQPQAEGFMQGLTTNLPTKGIGAMAGRAFLPTAVPTIAGLFTGGTSIPLAGAESAAGEGIRQALVSGVSAYKGQQPQGTTSDQLADITGRVGIQGLAGAASQGIIKGVGAALGSRTAAETGGQAMQALNATPKKYGSVMIEGGAETIKRGKQLAEGLSEESYKAFENYTGLQGLRNLITRGAKYSHGKIIMPEAPMDAAESILEGVGAKNLENSGSTMVKDVALRVKAGETLDPQTLYVASQMANNLRTTNPFVPEAQKLMAGSMTIWKHTIEDALEKQLPEYASLRTDRFLAAAGQRASSLFPLNKDMSVNALRSYGAMQTGLGAAGAILGGAKDRSLSGAEHGAAVGVGLGALAASPRLAFGAIQAGSRAVQTGLPQLATKAIGSMSFDEIYQYLRGQKGNATP